MNSAQLVFMGGISGLAVLAWVLYPLYSKYLPTDPYKRRGE